MAITITAATWATNQATFTTSAAHGILPGTQITISGITPAGYNGTFVAATGTTGSTIVVAMPVNPGTYSSGGTVADDPFAAVPAIITGRIGVAKDGSIWGAAAGSMIQLAPPGTVVHPDYVEPSVAQAAAVAAENEGNDEEHKARRRR